MHEQTRFWGYQALRFGEEIGSGPNPVPKDILDQATEIRWLVQDPSLPEVVEDEGGIVEPDILED